MTDSSDRKAIGNLPNQPLVEAIFELGWSYENTAPNSEFWDALPGLFLAEVREEYPKMVNLPSSQVPVQLTGNHVRHQYRVAKDGWPLIQIGPGILTVNDTSGYTVWENFFPRIEKAVDALKRVTEAEPFERAELRYINSVEFDPEVETLADFVEHKLHVKVTKPSLFDGEGNTDEVTGGNITLQLPLKNPRGKGEILIARGINDGNDSVVFHIRVVSKGKDAPKNSGELKDWAKAAHDIVDSWFESFCAGTLMEGFQG